jgi:hypothetical protein
LVFVEFYKSDDSMYLLNDLLKRLLQRYHKEFEVEAVKDKEFEENYSIEECMRRAEKCKYKGSEYNMKDREYNIKNGTTVSDYHYRAIDEYEKAVKWYEKAAAMGSAEAQYMIGVLYKGETLCDLSSAKEAFNRAAAMGYKGAKEKADAIKESDIFLQGVICLTGLNVVAFFILMMFFSIIEDWFHVTLRPFILSGVIVGTSEVLFTVLLSDKIKSVRVGCITIIGILAIAVSIYLKFR